MNLFGIRSIIVSLVSIIFSFLLLIENKKSKVNRAWFIESVSISLWSLGLYGVTSATSLGVATKWQYILDFSAVYIPVLYFNFISVFLKSKNRIFINVSLFIAAILSLFSFTSLFKLGVEFKYGFYWVEPGKFYVIFPIFFIIYTCFSLYLLMRTYAQSKNDLLLRKQTITLFWGFLIGSVGGITNFFPQLFNIYPFGNFLVLVYFLFMGYAIIRFELLNLKIISAEFFSSAIVFVFLFNLLRSTTQIDWAIGFLLFLLSVFFSLFLVLSVKKEVQQRERIQVLASDLEKANKEMEKANERLKELDKLKSEFVSLATHQIRAPLTAIKGYVSLVEEGDYGSISDKVREAMRVVHVSTDNLVTIVNDFLNVSRIEQGTMKYDFKTFNLEELSQQVVTELKPNAEKKGLKITYCADSGKDYTVYGDLGKIKQIISNIIDNSTKYTPKGHIAVAVTRPNEEKVLIKVSDTGVGIPAKVMPKLFQKFSRASTASDVNILGTGLGLYIAKQMVEAHKGRIWAESEGDGKGSQFYIELPTHFAGIKEPTN